MKPPALLSRVESISRCERRGAYWMLDIAGTAAWYRDFAEGACIAMRVDYPLGDGDRIVRAALWIASVREGIDDGLLLEDERLWFARRYAYDAACTQTQAALAQQLAVVRWLGIRCARSDAIARAGAAGVWA
ncbi:hypothetical protein WKR88_27170 [Trinickia caryophylli]|uniref:Uncharacterized protein n=1 Tax=Trinickia caryophylli TaxID=28094 RepID=A0A1X7EW37_TRICW|nr:hypothetical protein [Trinickia caryophylli]PMS09692.1 hypothetical protein C0Z17_23740 [Trinickia caryophylli]TRX18463.1 hypothetical protein FNF07_09700 [Trinickia caryophylli]WQE10751.1 hypothetical protein U0034_13230 [Trinickia caryophylli]SMF41444.1 hypothetical protein SAMN06295900_106383 [Trinickia caryophylli]GLU33126.1 hypothetical protein Busp01_29680 [Trinickia caryophylli]